MMITLSVNRVSAVGRKQNFFFSLRTVLLP